MIRQGKDDFGPFVATGGLCEVCGEVPNVCIRYNFAPRLPDGIELKDTIFKDREHIGILCGCYAKFHRQVAHIEDRMKARQSS